MVDHPAVPGAHNGIGTHGAPTQFRHDPDYRTAWQLWRRAEHPDALAALGLRTKSPVVLDALALAATGGTHPARRLVRTPELLGAAPSVPPTAALALALAGMGRSEQELMAATRLYEHLWALGVLGRLAPIHHQGLGQSFFLAGRHEQLRHLLGELTKLPAPVRHDLEVDLANPYLSGAAVAPAQHQQWVRLLATRFTDAGLAPLTVQGTATHLFDRLGCQAGTAGTAEDGPLVSVIMPCFRPDEGLLTSIASLTAQTWGPLEILVVDDASGPEYAELFEQAVASDPRARLIRLAHNGGSYLGRNAALAQARGELITFQDADDWSHPARIGQQARVLLDDPQAAASRSLAVRAKDDLTHQWFGYRSVRDNASSLMVRRCVIETIGPFAPIRKGADSEYAERLTTVAGPVVDTGSPLAITRLRTGTLSRGDFTYQWASPERLAFKGSYRAWHQTLDVAAGAAAVPDPTVGDLPFPVPRSFRRGLEPAPAWARLPVVYLADYSAEPRQDEQTATAALWSLLADRDGRLSEHAPHGQQPAAPDPLETPPTVGLWHLESARSVGRTRPEMHPAWFRHLVGPAARAVPVTRTEAITVDRLVVLDPWVLLLAGAQPTALQVGRVEIRLHPHLLQPDASGLSVDLLRVGDVCRAWWGCTPQWVAAPEAPQSARDQLVELVPGLLSG